MAPVLKKAKILCNILFYFCIVLLAMYIGAKLFVPQVANSLPGLQCYTVLSHSMEPRIPVYSLVVTRQFGAQEKVNLQAGDIITFKANRFGEDILITHNFYGTKQNQTNETIYRTIAEGVDHPDAYQTTRRQLVGLYLFHIPYLGKILLFLKSKFGLILLGEECIILLLNQLVKSIWEEKAAKNKQNRN